ncbi:DNA polymerase-1 [Kibdelosporangium banguiense]|uniref:DNA polymerase I n=1 Tax=Kibdelosporangium banguiense TaxID=1365924 RepID=A0ABS4TH01_9PSEU|nr:DNA polymerase [Kibdelosporangium banguiense]MBP2323315.1 DNA polymerase-1 [Kibdelosporangium banguiense]
MKGDRPVKIFKHRVNGDEVPIFYPERDQDITGFERFLTDTPRVLGLDTETTGLKIYSRGFRTRLVQFGDKERAWVLRADQFRGVIAEALAAQELRFAAHNAPFDLLVLDRCGLASLESLGPRTFDTYILAHLCDPRTEHDGGAGLGLKPLSTVYVDNDAADTAKGLYEVFRREYKANKSTGWALIDIDHPLYVTYAGLDVVYTARLLAELGLLIKQAGLSKLAQFEHRVQLITTHQQRRGLLIDVDYTKKLVDRLEEESETYLHIAKGYGVENVNSTRQVIEGLQGMGEAWKDKTATGNPAVGKEVLLPMADLDKDWSRIGRRDPNPLADAILRSKRAAKWRESYALPFLTDRDENDRIHPFIKSLAARTARMSVSGPPLQQLPSSDWTIRRAIVADPGWLVIASDYAQVEMRVLAAMADVKEMKKAILQGVSIHEYTANLLWPNGYEKWQYKIAKNTGFAKVFGGGAATISKTSGATLEEVRPVISSYDEAFPEIPAYGRVLQRKAAYGGGAVVTPIGRRLPLDRERAYAATNYMVQSTARDILAKALCAIDDASMSEYILLPVHDELVAQAPAADAEEVIREIGRLMERDFMGIPITSDPEVYGRSWGAGYMAAEQKRLLDAA